MPGPVVALAAFLVLGALAAVAARRWHRRAESAWSEAARRLGLRYTPGRLTRPRRLSGELGGLGVVVHTVARGSGNSRRTYTDYDVTFPALGLDLCITRESLMTGIAVFFGGQDIEVGDAAFDGGHRVRGADPGRVRAFLTDARRTRIARLFHALPGVRVHDSGLHWSRRGVETDPRRLAGTVERLLATARSLRGEGDEPLEEALEAQAAGDLEGALQRLRRADARDPDARFARGGILYAGGRLREASGELRSLADEHPEDAEARGLAELVERAERGPAPAPPAPRAEVRPLVAPSEPRAPLPAADAPETSPTPSDVCGDLFRSERMSFEVQRAFDERWTGRAVRWQGELLRVEPFRRDLVFSEGPGTRAVVQVHVLDRGLFGLQPVRAIVRLPESEAAALRGRIGEPLAFTGRLVRCDAILYSLFVDDGTVRAPEPGSAP